MNGRQDSWAGAAGNATPAGRNSISYERTASLGSITNAFSGFQAQQFAHAHQQQQQQQPAAAAYLQQQHQMRQQQQDQQVHEQQTRPDMSEFPSLGSPPGLTNSSTTPLPHAGQLYRTIVGARADRQPGSSGPSAPTPADFPALSVATDSEVLSASNAAIGTSVTKPEMTLNAISGSQSASQAAVFENGHDKQSTFRAPGAALAKLSSDGVGTQIPIDPADRFGMLGLLTTNDYGFDVSKFGLPLPSAGPLYPTFGSPWTDQSQAYGLIEPDFKLPACYNASNPPPAMSKVPSLMDETLFYIFYTMPRDELQLAAAEELYRRQWRYHKELRLWLTKDPDSQPIARTPRGEQGVFVFFDPGVWQKVKKEFLVLYEMLEDRGSLSAGSEPAGASFRGGAQSVPPLLQQQSQQPQMQGLTAASINSSNLDQDSSAVAAAQAQLQNILRFNGVVSGSQQQQQQQQQLAILRRQQQESLLAADASRGILGQAGYSNASISGVNVSGMYSAAMTGARVMGVPAIDSAAPSSSMAPAPEPNNLAEDVAAASMA
ncbi:hypothetical protein BX070DRAFT_228095 [Coemansia spiralis]|nr:hypothetical protein BX070DRAFT_228095 [Coemansia spiralis]